MIPARRFPCLGAALCNSSGCIVLVCWMSFCLLAEFGTFHIQP